MTAELFKEHIFKNGLTPDHNLPPDSSSLLIKVVLLSLESKQH